MAKILFPELSVGEHLVFYAYLRGVEPKKIVDWIIEDDLNVRFQLQIHKFIWEPEKKGV